MIIAIPKNIKIKKLKTSVVGKKVPKQQKGNEGNVGRHLHEEMGASKHGVDSPILDMDLKTRKRSSKAPHTTGTMTFDDIMNTEWENTTFAQKLQNRCHVVHDDTFSEDNEVVSQEIFDFRGQDIQDLLKRDFDIAKAKLKASGKGTTGTIVGGEFGMFEHRGGNTYAHRITDSGMKKLEGMAKSTYNDLFKFE